MKSLLTTITLLYLSLSILQAQIRTSSYYTYIFSVSDEEAEEMYQSYFINELAYFHTLVDSFPNDSVYKRSLPDGYYIFASVEKNQLNLNLKGYLPVHLQIHKNGMDLSLEVKDNARNTVTDANIKIRKKAVPFDPESQTYLLPATKKEGLITVEWKSRKYFFTISHDRGRFRIYEHPVLQKVVFGFPLGIVTKPVVNIFQSIRYRQPLGIVRKVAAIFDKDYRRYTSSKYTDYIYTNKPIYRPGDTVKFKAFVLKKHKRPIQRPLELIFSNNKDEKRITTIRPSRPGNYHGSFVLDDSLDFDIDESYTLFLKKRKGLKIADFSISIKDYELAKSSFDFRIKEEKLYKGDPITLFARAYDENDLNLFDAKVNLYVLSASMTRFYRNQVFVPDTIWQETIKLDLTGETSITIPDSVMPPIFGYYQVDAVMTTANLERKTASERFSYDAEPGEIVFTDQDTSLNISFQTKTENSKTKAILTGMSRDYKYVFFTKEIELPWNEPFDPEVGFYTVRTKDKGDVFRVKDEAKVVIRHNRTKDSLFVKVENPRNLSLVYFLYRKNKEIKRGRTRDVNFSLPSTIDEIYTLSVHYIWAGKSHDLSESIPFYEKQLTLSIEKPERIHPGDKAEFEVTVKDLKGNPVREADLTSYAFTKKFDANNPRIPRFGRYFPTKRDINQYYALNEFTNSSNRVIEPDHPFFKQAGLDSLTYYQFIYPKTGIGYMSFPIEDDKTEFAPFIVNNGYVNQVPIIYLDDGLIYDNSNEVKENYAFAVDSGYHKLSLQYSHKMLTIDSVYFRSGEKTVMSINPDAKQILTIPIDVENVDYVLNKRENYFFSFDYHLAGKDVMITQGEVTYRIFGGSYNTHREYLVGPLRRDSMTILIENGEEIRTVFEPGYTYIFEPGLIKMREKDISKQLNKHPSLNSFSGKFDERAYTPKDVWKDWETKRMKETEKTLSGRLSPTNNKQSTGELMVRTSLDSIVLFSFLRHISNPDSLRSFIRIPFIFPDLEPGDYELIYLLSDTTCAFIKNLKVKANGLNYYADSLAVILSLTDSLLNEYEEIQEVRQYLEDKRKIEAGIAIASLNPEKSYGKINNYLYRGRVLNNEGNPMIGASVLIEGTQLGAFTDEQGDFEVYGPSGHRLTIAYVGYVSQTLSGTQNGLYYMERSDLTLDEVVVTALGIRGARASGSVYYVDGMVVSGYSTMSYETQEILSKTGSGYFSTNDLLSVRVLSGKTPGVDVNSASFSIKEGQTDDLALDFLDESGELLNHPLNNQSALRQNFSDYAWWQPTLFTDANGKARFSVKFPDDITNWRARFIAIDGKKLQSGYLETEIPAYKDISATLFAPRFLIQGDSTEVIGQVNNYINDTLAVRASFLKEEEEIFNQSFDLVNGKTDVFSVAAEDLDSLSLTYRIDLEDGYFDGEKRHIPVLRKGTTETKGEFFALKNDTSFTIDPSQWGENVTISAYTNSLDLALAEIDHLTRYPYACNEQTASKLIALLAEQTIREHLGQPFKHTRKVKQLISQLEKNQNSEGLWGWWETSLTEIWVSMHVLEACAKAEKMGYQVNIMKWRIPQHLVRELEYMSTLDKIRSLETLRVLHSNVDFDNQIARIEKEELDLADQLALMKLKQELDQTIDTDKLINLSHKTLLGNRYWGEKQNDLFSGRIPLTLMAYQILKRAGKEDLLPEIRGYFLERLNNGHWGNTYETAQILETILPDWIESGEKTVTGSLTISGEEIASFPYQQTLSKEKPLTIQQKGKSPVYFSIYQTTYNPEPEVVDKDFVVKTWWKNQSSDQLEAGKPVSLMVEVEVKQEADYLMIEVPIPAGCSYHNDQLNRSLEVHRENYKEKTNIYCRRLGEGKHVFEVSLLPRYSGHYHLNPAKAEQMYFPLFFGRNEGKEVRIAK